MDDGSGRGSGSAVTRRAVIACLLVVVAPATADDHPPRSLRMRPPRPAASPTPHAPRVAQAPPDAAPSEPADDASPASVADDGKTEVISVTDTTAERQIEHELFTGRAPVSVVTRADLATSGRATIGDILQALPAQSNAGNAQVNAGGDGTTRINLRGLGAARTLVLLNGRRLMNSGAGADASVDIDAIPLPMIERVEVLKDGASAIYGADAVGGVVNVITRPQFNGTDVTLLTSTSQHGDGTEFDASVVTGATTRSKHTYLVVSGEFQGHGTVLASDRAFSTFQNSYDFASKTERRNGSLATSGGRLDVSSIGPGGLQPPGCASNVCRPDPNGGFTDFVAPGELYNDATGNYLYTPSRRYNVIATAGNRINDHLAVVLELMYLRRNSDRQLSPAAFVADAPISKDSLYNPLGADILDYRRRFTELGPRHFSEDATLFRYVVGFTGDVPESVPVLGGWKYELSFNHGDSRSEAKTTGQLFKLHVADSIGPSMIDADGHAICVRRPGDASTKIIYVVKLDYGPDQMVPCLPLNLLAPAGGIPQNNLPYDLLDRYADGNQLDQLSYEDQGFGSDATRTLLATAGGRIAKLPHHGDISLSLGGDYRAERGDQSPPPLAASGSTDDMVLPTEGEFHMYEGFGELAIVPFSGHAIARWVELDLGARALRDSRFGSSLTYKLGGLFRTVQGVSARATYATAFRAPTLRDAIGGQVERTPAAEDPCDTAPPSVGEGTRTLDPMVQAQCTAQDVPVGSKFNTSQQISRIAGNPALEPETAATVTFGVVVEPPQLPGLAVSVDYWHIAIDQAIETLGIQTIFANCYERGIQSYCDQIQRNFVTHRISPVDQPLQNVPRTVTSGVDLALRYDATLAPVGRIRAALEGQYLVRYDLDTSAQVIHGVGVYDLGVYPHYKANLSARWAHAKGASAGFTVRYVGSYKECANNNCNTASNLALGAHDVDRYVTLDLLGGYDIGSRVGKTTLQLGINNVFDATPPVVYNAAAANSDAATYEFVGRMAYVRLSQLF